MSKEFKDYGREFVTRVFTPMAFRIRMSEGSRSETRGIARLLEQRPELSFIAYFNHVSSSDPFLAAYVVEKIDPNHTRHLIAPASYSYLDPNGPKNTGYKLMIDLANMSGVEVVRVVQSHQVGDPEFGYSREFAENVNQNWSQRVEELGRSGEPVGCLISPEGHRSETGIMGRVQGGIVSAGRKLAPVVYIPIGIVFEEKFNRKSLNLNKKVRLNIGRTIIQENREQSPALEEIISNLANTLPEDIRGRWNSNGT